MLNALKTKLLTAFANLGVKNGTAPGPELDVNEKLAYELFTASTLATAADKRKEAAKAAALKAGIIRPVLPGSSATVFSGKRIAIMAATKNAGSLLNEDALKRAGVTEAQIAAGRVEKAPATTYTVLEV